MKKKKVPFEELLKANRRELLEDEKQIEKIEERIEERRLGQNKLMLKGEI
ncbi:FbpB family small basic protein [Mesobacillus thioparans]